MWIVLNNGRMYNLEYAEEISTIETLDKKFVLMIINNNKDQFIIDGSFDSEYEAYQWIRKKIDYFENGQCNF